MPCKQSCGNHAHTGMQSFSAGKAQKCFSSRALPRTPLTALLRPTAGYLGMGQGELGHGGKDRGGEVERGKEGRGNEEGPPANI